MNTAILYLRQEILSLGETLFIKESAVEVGNRLDLAKAQNRVSILVTDERDRQVAIPTDLVGPVRDRSRA